MKRVIINTPQCGVIHVKDINTDLTFGCEANGKKYILRQEHDGFIFRDSTNMRYGHSGSHPTMKEAIERAATLSHTRVFQFDTYEDLGAWLVDR